MEIDKLTLSLLIPTRERREYLKYTIESALDQNSMDFEVIVSDNYSHDRTEEVVSYFNDSRLRYVKTKERLSMCGNYEFAFEAAKGKYVIFVGDDDAVIPGMLDRLLPKLREDTIGTIYSWPLHIYDWQTANTNARLAYFAPQSSTNTQIDLKKTSRKAFKLGGWRYHELPSPYHSAVPRSKLLKIKQRTGKVFSSTQPDVYTAMSLPAVSDSAIRLGWSVTVHGRSPKSNGINFIRREKKADNIDKFLSEYESYKYDEALNPSFSGKANMIADSILCAAKDFPELYEGEKFGFEAMYALMCRYRFLSPIAIFSEMSDLKRRCDFSIASFAFFIAIHSLSSVMRKCLDVIGLSSRGFKYPGSNIIYFVKLLKS